MSSYNATVIKKEILGPELFLLTVKPDQALGGFLPGQFAVLGLKAGEPRFDGKVEQIDDPEKMIRKAYSIASSPVSDYLEFYIALVPGGAFTPKLFALKEGSRIFLSPKASGKFTLKDIPAEKHLLMIGTGTGLAPFLSMIRTELICHGPRHFIVMQGARYSWDLGFYSELIVMDKNCTNFHYIPCVSRPAEDPYWCGPKGRVTDVIREGWVEKKSNMKLSPEIMEVLLCGNPDMIKDMTTYLISLGFNPDTPQARGEIHTEQYWT